MQGKAVFFKLHLGVLLHQGEHEVVLQIWTVEIGTRLQKGPRLQAVLPTRPLAGQHILQTDRQLLQALGLRIKRDGLGALPVQGHIQVVLQIGTYARQGVNRLDASLRQALWVANAGQVEDLRRLEGASAQQHLARGIGRLQVCRSGDAVIDADSAALFKADLMGVRAKGDGQIRAAFQDRVQIALRRTPATPVLDGQLIAAKALLRGAVKVLRHRIARLPSSLDDAGIEGMAGPLAPTDAQRAISAVIVIGTVLEAFGLFEIGQRIGIGPALQAHLAPLIIVAGMAANIDHAIDGRRAAKPPTSGVPELAPIHVGFRLAPKAPIKITLLLDQRANACRHAHQDRGVLAARFKQQHLHIRIFC